MASDLPPWAPQFLFHKEVAGLSISAEIWNEIPEVNLRTVSDRHPVHDPNRVRLSLGDACCLAEKLGQAIEQVRGARPQVRESVFLEPLAGEFDPDEDRSPLIPELSVYADGEAIQIYSGPGDNNYRIMFKCFANFRMAEVGEVVDAVHAAIAALE